MLRRIIDFIRGKAPQTRTWADVRQEILRVLDDKVVFDITPRYFTVTSGEKTWYWNRDTGEFDGTSWSY